MTDKPQKVSDNQIEGEQASKQDVWTELKKYTQARIGQGRVGCSLPTKQQLQFNLDHAMARDAVNTPLEMHEIEQQLNKMGLTCVVLHSKAENRTHYLQRPDLGRTLSSASINKLKQVEKPSQGYDIALVLVDGLSSTGVQQHGALLCQTIVDKLTSQSLSVSRICLVAQGRVAIGDEIGFLLNANSTVLIVGERPGLSSPDSLGIYYTYHPQPGLNDASRNCISNVRPAGLSIADASEKLVWLVNQSFKRKLSGVNLKDNSKSNESSYLDVPGNFLINQNKS